MNKTKNKNQYLHSGKNPILHGYTVLKFEIIPGFPQKCLRNHRTTFINYTCVYMNFWFVSTEFTCISMKKSRKYTL